MKTQFTESSLSIGYGIAYRKGFLTNKGRRKKRGDAFQKRYLAKG
jgi:hypothetical protein